MKKINKFLSRLYDLPNAFRVLDIMDKVGCDIEPVTFDKFNEDNYEKYWQIKPKWYIYKQEAKDLQTILNGMQFKQRNKFWTHIIFRSFREGCRILPSWFNDEDIEN